MFTLLASGETLIPLAGVVNGVAALAKYPRGSEAPHVLTPHEVVGSMLALRPPRDCG